MPTGVGCEAEGRTPLGMNRRDRRGVGGTGLALSGTLLNRSCAFSQRQRIKVGLVGRDSVVLGEGAGSVGGAFLPMIPLSMEP